MVRCILALVLEIEEEIYKIYIYSGQDPIIQDFILSILESTNTRRVIFQNFLCQILLIEMIMDINNFREAGFRIYILNIIMMILDIHNIGRLFQEQSFWQ